MSGKMVFASPALSFDGILARIAEDGTITGVSAGTAVMKDVEGY